MKDKWLLGLSAFFVVFVLAGQIVTYWGTPFDYGSNATLTEDGDIAFSVSAPSSVFSVVAYDDGGFEAATDLYVFIDPNYGGMSSYSDQTAFLSQLTKELEIRGVKPPARVNAEELAALMSEPGAGKGILMLSGAFPDTVYSGSAGDLVFTWLDNMGSIYWTNGKIGRCVSHSDGTMTGLDGTDMLFFGMDGAVRASADSMTGTLDGPDAALGEMLSVNYGIWAGHTTNGLSQYIGGKTLAIGYSDADGYNSAVLTDCGKEKGMIAVFGGTLEGDRGDTRATMAQVIASGISYRVNPDEILYTTGTATGTYNGMIDAAVDLTYVYIFIGTLNPVYGNLFDVGAAGS